MASRNLLRSQGEHFQQQLDRHEESEYLCGLPVWQGALLTLAGAASSVLALQCVAAGPRTPAESPCREAVPRSWSWTSPAWAGSTSEVTEEAPRSSYAFVQIAYDEPGRLVEIWRAMAMARALQRLSRYPLVLLTNTTHLPGGVDVVRSLSKLNVQVLPVYDVPVPHGSEPDREHWRREVRKLQIWRLTEYDKLIWLDTDAILTRSVDWLFLRRATWAQGDGESCGASEGRLPSSGIMLIEPGEASYQHMVRYSETLPAEWWRTARSVTQYISEYAQRVEGRPVQLLQESTAARSSCLGRLPGIRPGVRGLWELPALVRADGGGEACFYWDVAEQLAEVAGQMVNICHYHPLGPYWRDLLCDAVGVVGSSTEAVEAFCDDLRWSTIGSLQVDLARNSGSPEPHLRGHSQDQLPKKHKEELA